MLTMCDYVLNVVFKEFPLMISWELRHRGIWWQIPYIWFHSWWKGDVIDVKTEDAHSRVIVQWARGQPVSVSVRLAQCCEKSITANWNSKDYQGCGLRSNIYRHWEGKGYLFVKAHRQITGQDKQLIEKNPSELVDFSRHSQWGVELNSLKCKQSWWGKIHLLLLLFLLIPLSNLFPWLSELYLSIYNLFDVSKHPISLDGNMSYMFRLGITTLHTLIISEYIDNIFISEGEFGEFVFIFEASAAFSTEATHVF